MTTVNSVTSGSALSAGNSAQSVKDAAKETEDRFLKLLVTQMKNQDPLNPLDNAQVTQQMAQLSTVSGINKLNDAVASISGQFVASQSMMAASLIGRNVVFDGNVLSLSGGGAKGAFELSQLADHVSVAIKDGAGSVVRNLDLGAQSAGTVSFGWDGTMDNGSVAPDGRYSLEIKATNGAGVVAATPYAVGRVGSVSLNGGQGPTLNLAGMISAQLSDIKQIM